MQRRWFVLPIVAVAGILSGTLIGGLPDNTSAPILLEPASQTADGVLTADTTSIDVGAPTVVDSTVASAAPIPTEPPELTRERQDVRLLLVSTAEQIDMAESVTERLQAAGYPVSAMAGNANAGLFTILYYRFGFEDEAWVVAGDLFIPGADLQPLPADAVDEPGDIVIILGADATA
jgi:hypothetical protein